MAFFSSTWFIDYMLKIGTPDKALRCLVECAFSLERCLLQNKEMLKRNMLIGLWRIVYLILGDTISCSLIDINLCIKSIIAPYLNLKVTNIFLMIFHL